MLHPFSQNKCKIAVNQSEFETAYNGTKRSKTCNQCRETCNQESIQLVPKAGKCVNWVTIGFSFVSAWSKETLVFLDSSQYYNAKDFPDHL